MSYICIKFIHSIFKCFVNFIMIQLWWFMVPHFKMLPLHKLDETESWFDGSSYDTDDAEFYGEPEARQGLNTINDRRFVGQ